MRFSSLIPQPVGVCFVLSCLAARATSDVAAYFVVDLPTTSTTWVNGAANPITWTKGLGDGIDAIDIEMARLSDDGLIFIAKSVPAKNSHSLYVYLDDVPAGDDYFLLLVNSTHGGMYSTSNRFTILAAGDSKATATSAVVAPTATTVTISGSPNPTKAFTTTFAAENGVLSQYWALGRNEAWSALVVTTGCVLGALWTLS